MPTIITLAHQKGGVGKSTLAIHLANYYAHNGVKCAIVDTDLQGSVTDAFASFEEQGIKTYVKLIKRTDFKKYKDLQQLDQYDLLVVDTPPVLTNTLTSLFSISDVVLIPMKPAVNDFFALSRTIKFVDGFLKLKPSIKTAIVLNMTVSKSAIQKDIRSALEDTDIYVCDTEVGQRVEFMRCLLYASSIFDTSNKKAKADITGLGDEIYALLKKG